MTVYIKLLHGRDDPDQDMQDWGFAGPLLGPFEALHFTYRNHIRCISNSATEEELELGFTDDMLTYEGKRYGDFEIAAEFAGDTRKISPPRPQTPIPGAPRRRQAHCVIIKPPPVPIPKTPWAISWPT